MYKKFYFLHIPKTSGRFCKENIVNPLLPVFANKGISCQLYPSHANWDIEYIDSYTYVFSIFRDPAKRIISHYCHDIVLDNEARRKVPVGTAKEINRYSFLSWVKENQTYLSNFQAKNFLLEDKTMDHEVKDFFNFTLKEDDKNDILKKIERTNILIKPINLNKTTSLLIQNRILFDFNLIKKEDNLEFFDNPEFYNEDSNNLFNMLIPDDLEYLNSFNEFDLEIYNNDSNFWNPDV